MTTENCVFDSLRARGSLTGTSGILLISAGGRIRNNTFTNFVGRYDFAKAIAISGSHPAGIEIAHNEFPGNTAVGGSANALDIVGATGLSVHHNIFHHNILDDFPEASVIVASSSGLIHNNTFALNNGGLLVTDGESLIVRNNIFAFNTFSGAIPELSDFDYNLSYQNEADNNTGPNGLQGDPIFFNPEVGDYRILWKSPAVDAGDPNVLFIDPDGSRNDIGAFSASELRLPVAMATRILGGIVEPNDNPTFVWDFTDTLGSQFAYEIEVGIDNDWSIVENWSSGPTSSTVSSATYNGLPLNEGTKYFYRVRVNNGSNWGDWRVASFLATCCIDAGDANDDGSVNIADITFLIARIFAGGPGSTCAGQADANGSGKVNIADVTFLINRIFAGGPAPVCGTTGA